MNLSSSLKEKYTQEKISARDAQRLAEFIAWGPVVFQASRLMVKFGILDLLRDSDEGLTREEIVEKTGLSDYAVKCLTEAALCIGTILVNTETDRFTISKVGWFLLNDPATRINIGFKHDVNYEGWFRLEESLLNGKPEGLKYFGDWPTIYEGLSSLPDQVQKSWFGFDHFYSDSSFPQALEIIFREHHVKSLYDVGGNTGKWALQCVGFDPDVEVTVLDLPQQIQMMLKNVEGKTGAERIKGIGINLLDEASKFPARDLWDRQRFEPAAFCLTMTSLYFTAMANGNSKMYNTEDMEYCVKEAGLEIEKIHDHLGQGHSIIVCKLKN